MRRTVPDIRTHLFIICPNNSGSTMLRHLLGSAPGACSLEREGQHITGFAGPSSRTTGTRRIWAARPEYVALFQDRNAYNWPSIRRAWQFHARGPENGAPVLVMSSPPFVLLVDQLVENIDDPRFIFMVRNPYAMVEGIMRRAADQPVQPGEDIRTLAARHAITCLRHQTDNIRRFGNRGAFFTYEDFCADPARTIAEICQLVPDLGPSDLGGREFTNRNNDQISRLTAEDLSLITAEFRPHQGILHHFGYHLLENGAAP